MFKALNLQNGAEIVILDAKWSEDIEKLRVMARGNLLVCQGCNHPVGVRAGQERRHHFAHKNLGDCSYVEESLALRNARAVLYEWLVSKFGDSVTIEKKVDSVDLPRPIDCWVEKDSKAFAYWIFDRGLKLEKRIQLFECFQKLKASVNHVFSIDTLRKDGDKTDSILLSPTGRDFLSRSNYDLGRGNTLNFLDPENKKILTFRGLRLIHQPQVYGGFRLESDLEETLVSPTNGEFVHKGEYERVQQHREEHAAFERRRSEAAMHNFYIASPPSPTYQPVTPRVAKTTDLAQNQATPSIGSIDRRGICVSCGRQTTDWYAHWVEDGIGKCKCNSCLKLGRFNE